MRAVRISSPGGPEVLALVDLADPEPGEGQLLVRTAAAGVNYVDTYHRSGTYPLPMPARLGREGAGTVVAVGPGPGQPVFAPGDHVAWKQAEGSYSDLVLVPAAEAVPVPAGLADETAAALMLQGLTAHYLLTSVHRVGPGQTVLVHAAAGGVGLLLTQIAVHLGARVIATAGSPEKAELARGAGAAQVVLYRAEDLVGAVSEATGGEGVDVVYDGVGRDTVDGSLRCLRRRGTLALFGAASGPVPPIDPLRLMAGSLFLTRPTLADFTVTREELLQRCGELLGWAEAGWLHVRIGHRYPLAQVRRAHEDLEGRRTTGKLLLLP